MANAKKPIDRLKELLATADVPRVAERCKRPPHYLYAIIRGDRESLSLDVYQNIVEDGFGTPLAEFFKDRPGPDNFDALWQRLTIAVLDDERRDFLEQLLNSFDRWAERRGSQKPDSHSV
jgi:hypothetical protein